MVRQGSRTTDRVCEALDPDTIGQTNSTNSSGGEVLAAGSDRSAGTGELSGNGKAALTLVFLAIFAVMV
jgi:hypothetical protein